MTVILHFVLDRFWSKQLSIWKAFESNVVFYFKTRIWRRLFPLRFLSIVSWWRTLLQSTARMSLDRSQLNRYIEDPVSPFLLHSVYHIGCNPDSVVEFVVRTISSGAQVRSHKNERARIFLSDFSATNATIKSPVYASILCLLCPMSWTSAKVSFCNTHCLKAKYTS